MGHQIEHRVTLGNCELTQCSCGRSALKIKDKVLLLSSGEVAAIAGIFGAIEPGKTPAGSDLAAKLSWLSNGKQWKDFSVQS
jgi:hypothetical protein